MRWNWLTLGVVIAIHDDQLASYGGARGIRDRGLLESALARPRNLLAYDTVDIAALAAAYGFGIVRNHPFVDGNKRTAFASIETFLRLNGRQLRASDEECILQMLSLAAGEIDEAAYANWVRTHLTPVAPRRNQSAQ